MIFSTSPVLQLLICMKCSSFFLLSREASTLYVFYFFWMFMTFSYYAIFEIACWIFLLNFCTKSTPFPTNGLRCAEIGASHWDLFHATIHRPALKSWEYFVDLFIIKLINKTKKKPSHNTRKMKKDFSSTNIFHICFVWNFLFGSWLPARLASPWRWKNESPNIAQHSNFLNLFYCCLDKVL